MASTATSAAELESATWPEGLRAITIGMHDQRQLQRSRTLHIHSVTYVQEMFKAIEEACAFGTLRFAHLVFTHNQQDYAQCICNAKNTSHTFGSDMWCQRVQTMMECDLLCHTVWVGANYKLENGLQVLHMLLRHGVNPAAPNEQGLTALECLQNLPEEWHRDHAEWSAACAAALAPSSSRGQL